MTITRNSYLGRFSALDCRLRLFLLLVFTASLVVIMGCGGGTPQKQQNREFFTSGSREADQRASQKMARDEQLAGSGEGAGEKEAKKSLTTKVKQDISSGTSNAPAQVKGKEALFDRLGGEKGINAIIEDFTPRALQDPRVNWAREDVKRGGFSVHRGQLVTWKATPENVTKLKKHMVQFIALATGGPAHYEGKEMKESHSNLHIDNSEFDAAVGDLKASLDKLQIANKEQKELLAIIESTRPEIVAER